MSNYRQMQVIFRRAGLAVAAALVMVMVSLGVLQLNVQAKREGGGPGCGGDLVSLLSTANDGDEILVMTGSDWETNNPRITKNITIQGGWKFISGLSCSSPTATFQFVWPGERSIMTTFNSTPVTPVITLDPSVISLTIQYLDIVNQGGVSVQGGGINGVISNGARIFLENLVIRDTQSTTGGGLYLEVRGGSQLIISGTQIINNIGDTGGGFEIHVFDNSQVILRNTQVSTNIAATGNGGGGRIVIDSGSVTLANSAFFDNQATNGSGGGLSVEGVGSGPANLILQNTPISGNIAPADPTHNNLHIIGDVKVLDKQTFLPIVRKNS